VRIRRLLFFLAAVVLGDTSLHAAFGPASRCLPPAALQATADTLGVTLPISELGPAIPNYDSKERDYLIRTIVFEASGEPEEGKAAVAFVILNRERSGRWGDNIEEVVTQAWQFEPWMTRRDEMEKLSPDDPRYESAAIIADTVLSGQMPDPTAGATHFLNPVVVRQRRGGSLPLWARGDGKPIGRHTFYSPSEGGAEPEQPTLSVSSLVNPLSCEHMEEKRRNTQLETDWMFDEMAAR
jgi:N-acetylmuramoyl-L-alanine amidase